MSSESFPKGLTAYGGTAQLYYEQNAEKLNLQCINCHLDVGHYNPDYKHERMTGFPIAANEERELYKEPAEVTSFENYTEYIPSTPVSFNMIIIPGGTFIMGSPDDESLRENDEGPVHEVTVSSFFMGERLKFPGMNSGRSMDQRFQKAELILIWQAKK